MTNEQIVREAYRRYLHREPSAAEIKAQIDEATKRGESVEQWIRRIATQFGDKDTAAYAGQAAAERGRGTQPTRKPGEQDVATPSRPKDGKPVSYANPWDPVIQDIKAQNPGISDGDAWRLYNTGQYIPQSWYPENPFTPNPWYDTDPAHVPDYKNLLPAGSNPDQADPQAKSRDAAVRRWIAANAKIVPGAEPDVGVLPDGTTVSLLSLEPKQVDDVTAAFAKLAAKNPNIPRYQDVAEEIDLSGRGYILKGEPSPEEQQLIEQFLAGDVKAAGPLAKMRMGRLAVTPKPGFDPILKALTLAGIGTGLGYAIGPIAGPILGPAIASGATSLVGSNGNWEQAGLAALGGAAGGAASAGAGGLLKDASGLTRGLASGAAGGLASGGTRAGLTELFGGEVNPWDIVVSALSGAASGGLTGGLTDAQSTVGSDPQGIGNFKISPEGLEAFLIKLGGMGASSGTTNALRNFFGTPSHLTPEAPGSPFPSASTMQGYRNAEMERARAELQARYEEYQAPYSEAMPARNAQIEEYRAKQAEALERLKKEALAYLEKVQASRTAPLPPIPVPQGSPLPPPPDPFDPSAAARGQQFAGDFPVSQGAGNSDFPISQQGGTPAPETTAVVQKSTTRQRLPLNILQIQAALGRRR